MTQIHYIPEQEYAPALYISEPLAEQADKLGITSVRANRTGLNMTMELATGGNKVSNLGQVILHTSSDPERIGEHGDLIYVDPRYTLQEAMAIPPSRYDLVRQYTPSNIGCLAVFTQMPSQEQLTRDVYMASYNSATSAERSFAERGIGAIIGAGVGTAYEAIGNLSDSITSIHELTNSSDPLKSAGILGLALGYIGLRKPAAAFRRGRHLKKLRDYPPIEATV